MRICNKCLIDKPLTDYPKDKARIYTGGLKTICRSCASITRKLYKESPETVRARIGRYKQRNREKIKAQSQIRSRIRSGKIVRQPCFMCGGKAESHHPCYEMPLDVTWLCRTHHREIHLAPQDASSNLV